MPECDYCGESFANEGAYLDHLASEHEGELGSIDQRRVADREPDESGLSIGPIALVGLLALAGGLVVWVTFFMGGGNASTNAAAFADPVQQPSNVGSIHEHGPINVTVGGEELDFSKDRYQIRETGTDAFHFEGGDGSRYHIHAQQVTLEFALESLSIGVRNDVLAFDGTIYNESSGDTVRYEVNGEKVNPETFVLRDGDDVHVVANESS